MKRELKKGEVCDFCCYLKLHIPSGRRWECDWEWEEATAPQKVRLELINEWNRMGMGTWQYCM